MSFTLGSFNTDNIPGFKAILDQWSVLPVEMQTEPLPSGDGSLYYRSRMQETQWVFQLELTGSSVNDVLLKADQISLALNPHLHGLQEFTPNAFTPWVWQGVLAAPILWERDSILWFSSEGVSRLHGQAIIATPDPYGYVLGPYETIFSPGSLNLVGGGTTSFYPHIEVSSSLNSAQRLIVGPVQVRGPLSSNQVLVLNFQDLEIYTKDAFTGVKIQNVAHQLLVFQRLTGVGTLNIPIDVSAGLLYWARGRSIARRI